jgi:uncharacterized protein
MAIFSILFGAGIVLFSERAVSRGRSAAAYHYPRTFWLLLIGLLHAYLLWYGDILVCYSLCALLVFLFRNRSPRTLLILGLIVVAVPSLIYLFFGLTISLWPTEALENSKSFWKPTLEVIRQEITAYRSGWLGQMGQRASAAVTIQTLVFILVNMWRAGGLMLVGMGLYKLRVLSASLPKRVYVIILLIGFIIGLPLVSTGIYQNFQAEWSLKASMYLGWQYNYWGSLFISMGYISIVMLLCQSKKWVQRLKPFSSAGRMALTLYIMQSLICTTLFYGHGFALFGRLERIHQIGIVPIVWIVQVIFSSYWMHYFRFGPLEWLWRSLTYRRFQSMRYHRVKEGAKG